MDGHFLLFIFQRQWKMKITVCTRTYLLTGVHLTIHVFMIFILTENIRLWLIA